MKQLSYQTLSELNSTDYVLQNANERILQFGEGNFLRAFVDYFVDILNERTGFNSKIVLCQPIANGLKDLINEQDGLYTLYLRGFENGEKVDKRRVISSVSRCINPYEDFGALLKVAHNKELRYIVSNTTEAGIVFDDSCKFDDCPPSSFPAKLTRFLFERYTLGLNGVVILSCELIDNNGAELKNCVNKYIKLWNLDAGFASFIEEQNLFCNTLVDRIVTGYPKADANELNAANGYEDKLLVAGEVFGFWVIEAPDSLKEELPFEKAGLPVLITADHTPYKKRKVRILNGAHTSMVPAAYLCGQSIVRECMQDDVIKGFMNKALNSEIIPTLTLPIDELNSFAASVSERFQNPFIDHALLAIALNSTSKWKARVMPSFKEYIALQGKLPECLTLSLAALIAFYKQECDKNANDDAWIIDIYKANKTATNEALATTILQNTKMWGEDLCLINGVKDAIINYLDLIDKNGMYETMKSVL